MSNVSDYDQPGLNQTAPSLSPAYVYSDELLAFDYGPNHPMQIGRLKITNQLIASYGLDLPPYAVEPATFTQMSLFHDPHYLEALHDFSQNKTNDEYYAFAYGLGHDDNPWFPGLWQWASLLVGASLKGMELVVSGQHPMAFVPAGGMHHGMPGRAAGFCYINDLGVVIKHLLAQGFKVAYIDLDAHHGDGVQWPFYENDQVVTISIHQHPSSLFPGSGFVEEMGRGKGLGCAVNIPLWPDSDDEMYIQAFESIIPPILNAFQPDYILTQLGVDAMRGDPITNLNITTAAYGHCVERLKEISWGRWIATGGGGYNIATVARGWTYAWAIMRGKTGGLTPLLPHEFCRRFKLPQDQCQLLDPPASMHGRQWQRAREEFAHTMSFLQNNLFPVWKI